MELLTDCIVCHGRNFKTRMESNFTGGPSDAAPFFLANRRGVVHGTIQQCEACGFIFTNPQFLPAEYDEIYKNAPGPTGNGITLDAGDSHRFSRLARNIRQDVGSTGHFLDFGCGRGGFLRAMNDANGSGFEVGAPSVSQAGPSSLTTGRFFDILGTPGFEPETYDLITSFDVFEHLPNLPEYVAALKGLLRPGGSLVITVPDAGSWNARIAGSRWNMYLLEHLWYFDRNTLKTFMDQSGFTQTSHRTLPYDAPLAHIARRVAQTYGWTSPELAPALSRLILPVPIGLMYAVFRRNS